MNTRPRKTRASKLAFFIDVLRLDSRKIANSYLIRVVQMESRLAAACRSNGGSANPGDEKRHLVHS